MGVVEIVNPARKVGATAVPLNYRSSDEEAAFVVDRCDAHCVNLIVEYAHVPSGDLTCVTPLVDWTRPA